MPKLEWDRLLETSRKHGPVYLIAGTSGYVRTESGLREFGVPPLSTEELAATAQEIGTEGMAAVPGCKSFPIKFGADYRFRADVVGLDSPLAIILTQLSTDAASSSSEGGE